jgi:hypothetical protein
MSINYNNITELLDIIQKFVHEPDNVIFENFMYKRLDPENISLNDLVKSSNFEYQYILNTSSSDKPNFEVLDTIVDNYNNKKIILKKHLREKPILLILQKNENNLTGTTSIIDIYYELFMNQIISEFIIYDKIPFYLINICNFNIKSEIIMTIPEFRDLVVKEYKLFDPSDSNTNFCISLYEHFNQYITLKELLKKNLSNDDIANILFQVLFSHAYLNYKLGNFRHNTFSIDSFLVSILESPQNLILTLGDLKFKLNNTKYICKLFNFRNSIFDKYTNDCVCIIDNPSYDIYMFYKTLYDYIQNININFDKIKIIISNFIPLIILEEKLLPENNFINKYPQYIIPSHILTKNNFFSSFINMDIKNHLRQMESDKKLIGGVIQSLTENSENNINMLTKKKINDTELGKSKKSSDNSKSKKSSKKLKSKKTSKKISKKSKRHSKKASKKSSKKASKKSISKVKMARETIDSNINNNIERKKVRNEEKEEKEDKEEEEDEEDNYEEVDNIDEISPDQENQNDDLLSNGDDDRQKVPLDDTERGINRRSKSSKKSSKKPSKKTSKNPSKKTSKKSSKKSKIALKSTSNLKREIMNLENEIKHREEKLKLKEKKSKDNNSTTMSFNFSDSSSVKSNKIVNGLVNNKGPMMQQQMQQQMHQQIQQQMQQTPQSKANIMLPANDLPMGNRQRIGVNNDINGILQNLNEDQLIPVLPEMQQMFDMNQLEMQQQQAYQRGQAPIDNYNGQPQIMDQSIVNMARNGKLPIPLLNGFQMSPGMGNGMGNGMGMGMGNGIGMGMGMGMGMGNGMGMGMGMDMGMNAGVPMADNIFEAGFQEADQTNINNIEQTNNIENNLNNKLTGGNKNFFLKKKK